MVKKLSCKSITIILYPSETATGEGSPGCKAPMSSMVALIALKSCKSLHLPDFFLMTKIGVFQGLLEGSVQFSSVAQSCPTLCDPMNRSTPGLPVHHKLPEFTQTHVHRVSDAIQPSHPWSSPSPPALNPSHHQSLFQ